MRLRNIFSLLLFASLSWPAAASAASVEPTYTTVPAQPGPRVRHMSSWFPTADAACQDYVYYYPAYAVLVAGPGENYPYNSFKCRRVSDNFEYPTTLISESVCALGTPGGTNCYNVPTCPAGYVLNGAMCDPLPPCPSGEHYEGTSCVCDAGYYRAPAEHRWGGQCIREATGDDLAANPLWVGAASTQCGGEYSIYTNGSTAPDIACSAGGGEPAWGGLVPLTLPVCAPSTFTPPAGAGYYMVVPYPSAGAGC